MDRAHVGLAGGIHRDRRGRLRLAGVLARDYRDPSESIRRSRPRSSRTSGAIAIRRRRADPVVELLGYRQTWAFLVGKSLTDPVWLFYLFWLPKFLDAD